MGSPGIDKWINEAPESWAKLASKSGKKISFNNFKKKFFDGAENENKGYLKKYLTETQLKKIYTDGYGGTIKNKTHSQPTQPTKPTKITVTRNQKQYARTNNTHWGIETQYVLKLAASSKPRSSEYNRYINILVSQGRTKQAAIKKVQRVRTQNKKGDKQ